MEIILAVKDFKTNSTVAAIKCKSMRLAEKAQQGVDRNLNHHEFYTEIEVKTELTANVGN